MNFLPDFLLDIAGQEVEEVLLSVDSYQFTSHDHKILVLWWLLTKTEDLEYGRVLAIEAAKSNSRISVSCELWLMEHHYNDLGIALSVLSSFEEEAYIDARWSKEYGIAFWDFLIRSLENKEVSVKIGVLSLLVWAHRSKFLSSAFPPIVRTQIKEKLSTNLADVVVDEEVEELETITKFLEESEFEFNLGDSVVRAQNRMVYDLMDAKERFGETAEDLVHLVSFAQQCALRTDAFVKSSSKNRIIETVRFVANEIPTLLLQAIVKFGEAVVGLSKNPEIDDGNIPDYGISMNWAPSASFPIHFNFESRELSFFDILSQVKSADRKPKKIKEIFGGLDAPVVMEFLRLCSRLQNFEGTIEVIKTDWEAIPCQRSIELKGELLGTLTISSLMKNEREKQRRSKNFIFKDFIPQANSLSIVFQTVDAILHKGTVVKEDIEEITSKRQVDYYKQASRILGFLDEDNLPTQRAYSINGLSFEDRLILTSIFFEDSKIGRAWRIWSNVDHLSDLEPDSAGDFLEVCAIGLNETTKRRRTSTLIKWYHVLIPKYPFKK